MSSQSQSDDTTELSPPLARALIRSLSRGTAVAEGVRYIHVGHSSWLAAQAELLDEIAEDGRSDTKFVRGTYGAGKSHFLSVVQDRARANGWATAHVECKVDRVEIDRFETLYPQITAKLLSTEILEKRRDTGFESIEPIRLLLETWTRSLLARAGVKDGRLTRPFDADNRIFSELQRGLLRSSLPADFTKALTVFARATLAHDNDTLRSVCDWLRGHHETARIPALYLRPPGATRPDDPTPKIDLRPIGKGTAHDVMRGLLWLVRAAGHSGLVLCIDEVEELAKLSTRKRQDQALQALREYVDSAGGDSGFRHLAMYLAATPEMFEGKDYFPRYDALATRIQPIGDELNWRAPVVDLDKTPLDATEMHEMARRISAVHRKAYPMDDATILQEPPVADFVTAVLSSRFRIAKPRLLTRLLVDELERARQRGQAYSRPDVPQAVATVAERLAEEERP